jgi:hypothetical protein
MADKTIRSQIEEPLSEGLSELIHALGKFGLFLIALSLFAALFRIFLKDLDSDLSFLTTFLKIPINPSSVLSFLAVGSAAVFLALYLTTILWEIIKGILIFYYQRLINVVTNVLNILGSEGTARFVNKLQLVLRYNIYFKDSWIAESSGEGKRLVIPSEGNNFQKAKFEITVVESQDNHWRAGMIFIDDQNIEYIFHIYQDNSRDKDERNIKIRIVERSPRREIRDRKATVSSINDKIKFELKATKNSIKMIIDEQNASSFEVPLSRIQNYALAGWADGRAFKIKFENIKIESRL